MLEIFTNGTKAMRTFAQMSQLEGKELERMIEALLAYCKEKGRKKGSGDNDNLITPMIKSPQGE